ncbi:hypothetical protein, partial [Salirhabdus euzebyi]|uniref:hypothetical protein n=1 Tax=Salirhabdus euzebyi TaxID=394506 RepID=UPI001C873D67
MSAIPISAMKGSKVYPMCEDKWLFALKHHKKRMSAIPISAMKGSKVYPMCEDKWLFALKHHKK